MINHEDTEPRLDPNSKSILESLRSEKSSVKPCFGPRADARATTATISELVSTMTSGDIVETSIRSDELKLMSNFRALLHQLYGAGKFSTTSTGEDGSKLENFWIMKK